MAIAQCVRQSRLLAAACIQIALETCSPFLEHYEARKVELTPDSASLSTPSITNTLTAQVTLDTPITSNKTEYISLYTTEPNMEIPQQTTKSTKTQTHREKTMRRQRLSEEAHIKRNRNKIAQQNRTAHIKNKLQGRSAEKENKQIAARINIATNKTWRKAQSTEIHTDTMMDTTPSPSNSRGNSSPEPGFSDERTASPDTDHTLYQDSDNGNTGHRISHVLMLADRQYALLEDELGNTKQQLNQRDDEYKALEQKFAEQRDQRIRDKKLVDDWSEEVATVDTYCKEVEGANQVLQDRIEEMTEKHKADIEAKDLEIEKLKKDHELALAAKDTETEKWRQACLQKDSTLQTTVKKLTAERDDIKRKANLEKRKIWKASKTKTTDLEAKLAKSDQTMYDCYNAISKNEETIVSLVARNQQLEKEHDTMLRMLRQKYTTGKELQRVIAEDTTGKQEAKELRATVKRLETHVGNLLDTLQNTVNDCTRHREAEQSIRAQSNRAQATVQLLKDKLALSKDQIRDAAKQVEQMQQGTTPAGTHLAALDAVQLENEDLRNMLQAERDEKADIQAKLDKLDSKNMSLAIEYDIIDAQLIEEKETNSTLRDSTEAAMQELRTLRKVVHGQQGKLTDQDLRNLLAFVSKTTEENKGLVELKAKMISDMQKVAQWGNTIEEKCKTDVEKAKEESDFWYRSYFDEAVPTTERLHAEIAALKAEKGEQHFIQSPPPANPVVYDRKILPFAVVRGLAGVPANLIPSAVHDLKFGTCLSATEDAVKTLRPQGWYPVYTAGKVWLSRMVQPFSEEEAAMQIQTGADHASPSTAESGDSSMRNTHALRNAHVSTSSSIYNDLPTDYEDLRTPFLTHTSSKRAHSPAIPQGGNQAARREAAQPTTLRAQQPNPKPQAARQHAQATTVEVSRVPEYRSSWQQINKDMTRAEWEEWDDELRMQWFKMYVKKDDD